MLKPLRFTSLLLLSATSVLLFSCGKGDSPTVINGRVTNKKTGEPIEGAAVYVDFRYTGYDGAEESDLVSGKTNAQGEFVIEHDSEYEYTYSEVSRNGYIPQVGMRFYKGIENNVDVSLAPTDGVLKLEIINQNDVFDSVYVILENPSCLTAIGPLGKIYLDKFPLSLPAGSTYIKYYPLPSEEYTKIHWGFSYFTSSSGSSFKDSVFLSLNDTAIYKLAY